MRTCGKPAVFRSRDHTFMIVVYGFPVRSLTKTCANRPAAHSTPDNRDQARRPGQRSTKSSTACQNRSLFGGASMRGIISAPGIVTIRAGPAPPSNP